METNWRKTLIDLHMHTVYSDGELIPAELARRARAAGYRAMAFTDHADHSNIEHIITSLLKMVHEYSLYQDIELLAGVELTHVPPALIPDLVKKARDFGAQIVLVHGETIVEPVAAGQTTQQSWPGSTSWLIPVLSLPKTRPWRPKKMYVWK